MPVLTIEGKKYNFPLLGTSSLAQRKMQTKTEMFAQIKLHRIKQSHRRYIDVWSLSPYIGGNWNVCKFCVFVWCECCVCVYGTNGMAPCQCCIGGLQGWRKLASWCWSEWLWTGWIKVWDPGFYLCTLLCDQRVVDVHCLQPLMLWVKHARGC